VVGNASVELGYEVGDAILAAFAVQLVDWITPQRGLDGPARGRPGGAEPVAAPDPWEIQPAALTVLAETGFAPD
jgi:hypothetical protein